MSESRVLPFTAFLPIDESSDMHKKHGRILFDRIDNSFTQFVVDRAGTGSCAKRPYGGYIYTTILGGSLTAGSKTIDVSKFVVQQRRSNLRGPGTYPPGLWHMRAAALSHSDNDLRKSFG